MGYPSNWESRKAKWAKKDGQAIAHSTQTMNGRARPSFLVPSLLDEQLQQLQQKISAVPRQSNDQHNKLLIRDLFTMGKALNGYWTLVFLCI